MSATAMFALKYPSMHSFRKDFQQDIRSNNLKNLFGVQNVPSDTTIRKVLDEVETSEFQGFFKRIFSLAQRGTAILHEKQRKYL